MGGGGEYGLRMRSYAKQAKLRHYPLANQRFLRSVTPVVVSTVKNGNDLKQRPFTKGKSATPYKDYARHLYRSVREKQGTVIYR